MKTKEKPILTFQVISDTEVIAAAPEDDCNKQFDAALSAVEREAPESKAIFICGDILNRGTADNWIYLNKIISAHTVPKIYKTLGNHDLTDNGTYEELFGNYMKYSGMTGTYYDTWISGYHFIAIAQEDSGHNKPIYTDKLFCWLEERLAENASYDKPIFLFSHYSIRNTTAGTYLGQSVGHAVGSEDKLRLIEILKRYPQVIYFTGHTHYPLTDPNMHYNIDVKNGRGADIICDGSGSYLSVGTYVGVPGAQFCFAEVYSDSVRVRGFDICKQDWMPEVDFRISTLDKTPTESAIPKLEIVPEVISGKDDTAVTAYITFEDDRRVAAPDGAWAGFVSSDKEGVIGDTLRWVMLCDLPRDEFGRYVWELSNDKECHPLSMPWESIIRKKGVHHIGLFEDTLYMDFLPTAPTYHSYCYDPYARLAKADLTVGAPLKSTISGSGTDTDPYLISTPDEFICFIESIAAGETYRNKYFLQTANLDFSETVYYIVDSEQLHFDGIYNGNGYVMRNISSAGGTLQEYAALFPTVTGTVMNLGIEDCVFRGRYASGIVRRLHNGGRLFNSYSRATVLCGQRAAGLVNYISGSNSIIDNCYFAGKSDGNAIIGSDWNAENPVLKRVYCEMGSAENSAPFESAAVISKSDLTCAEFVKRLNDNRADTAKAAGFPKTALNEWTDGADGYPVLIPR